MKSKGNKKGRARKRSKKVKEGMKSRKVGEAGKGREEQEKKNTGPMAPGVVVPVWLLYPNEPHWITLEHPAGPTGRHWAPLETSEPHWTQLRPTQPY